MKISSISAALTAALAFIVPVAARIESFFIPAVVAAGDTINVKLASSNYIQSVLDVSDFGNTNITQNIHIPNTYSVGQAVSVKVALTSFYGAGLSPVVAVAAANVTIGTTTQGSNFKRSTPFITVCNA